MFPFFVNEAKESALESWISNNWHYNEIIAIVHRKDYVQLANVHRTFHMMSLVTGTAKYEKSLDPAVQAGLPHYPKTRT